MSTMTHTACRVHNSTIRTIDDLSMPMPVGGLFPASGRPVRNVFKELLLVRLENRPPTYPSCSSAGGVGEGCGSSTGCRKAPESFSPVATAAKSTRFQTGFRQIAGRCAGVAAGACALPLDRLVGEIRNMVTHADGVVASPDVKHSLHELDRTLANTERLTRDAQTQVGPLFASINSAADQLKATIALLGSDPRSSNDLLRTLTELKDAARSIRVLADYLERHPESLLRGKPQEASR